VKPDSLVDAQIAVNGLLTSTQATRTPTCATQQSDAIAHQNPYWVCRHNTFWEQIRRKIHFTQTVQRR